MSLADSTATGKVGVLTGVSANKTNVKATASGANTVWKSKDEKTVVTLDACCYGCAFGAADNAP